MADNMSPLKAEDYNDRILIAKNQIAFIKHLLYSKVICHYISI